METPIGYQRVKKAPGLDPAVHFHALFMCSNLAVVGNGGLLAPSGARGLVSVRTLAAEDRSALRRGARGAWPRPRGKAETNNVLGDSADFRLVSGRDPDRSCGAEGARVTIRPMRSVNTAVSARNHARSLGRWSARAKSGPALI